MKIGLIGDSLTEGSPGVAFFTILKEKYPNISFVNHGKSGDTVLSLQTRLSKLKLDTDYDLIFLWIGVNDVYSKMLKVQAQPVAKDHDEFRKVYSKLVEMISPLAKQVIAVSPAIVGENIKSDANNQLKELSTIIETISTKDPNVKYLDMGSIFEKHLIKLKRSDYISTGVFRVMKDALFFRNPNRIDQLSKERGLHLTLDGVHFNSIGAKIVAKEYAKIIEQMLKEQF